MYINVPKYVYAYSQLNAKQLLACFYVYKVIDFITE